MHECFDPGEQVGFLLGVIDSMQHGKVLVVPQCVVEDRDRHIAEHAVEHKEIAYSAGSRGGELPHSGRKGGKDRIDIIVYERGSLIQNCTSIESAKRPQRFRHFSFHTPNAGHEPPVAQKEVESGAKFTFLQTILGVVVLGEECITVRYGEAVYRYLCTQFLKAAEEVMICPAIKYGVKLSQDANDWTPLRPIDRDRFKASDRPP